MSFDYESLVVDIPDYPKPGVVFKDVTPVFADPAGFAAIVDDIAAHFAPLGATKVVGAEARGFMVGSSVAYRLGAGFVPARKPGKLPREVYSEDFELEYGTDSLQIHVDGIQPGEKVLIVDDLAATGGTAVAMAKLVEQAGAQVVGFGFFMELAFLNPRETIAQASDAEVFSLYKVE